MAIIEQHLDDTEFNVNVFAREMAMARTNLFTKLKAITGQTPNDFILTIRLKKGALMLRNNPELNITEISDKIGFSSSRYFSKCFKDIYHVSLFMLPCVLLYTHRPEDSAYLWTQNQTLKSKGYETFI